MVQNAKRVMRILSAFRVMHFAFRNQRMSKHSKWAKVKNDKGVADAKRANVFTKLGRAITVAAKMGGADPAMNFHLRMAIEKAKESSMPKDTIERAVVRGTGTGEGTLIEEVVYEGFGPGGAALIIHGLTDNKNRTLQNVRTILSKKGGTMAGQNAVAWMFEKRGILRVPMVGDGEQQMLQLIDLGADDVREEDEGFTVTVAPDVFEKTKAAIEAAGMKTDYAEVSLVPKESVTIDDADERAQLDVLVDALEDDEDVDDVVTNVG